MATHTITLSTDEESAYKAYLKYANTDDESVMESVKAALLGQVSQSINDACAARIKKDTTAKKIEFLDT